MAHFITSKGIKNQKHVCIFCKLILILVYFSGWENLPGTCNQRRYKNGPNVNTYEYKRLNSTDCSKYISIF